jgi:hypothetical protein
MREAPLSQAAPDRAHSRVAHRSRIAHSRLPERGVSVHLTINSLIAALVAVAIAGCGGTAHPVAAPAAATIQVAPTPHAKHHHHRPPSAAELRREQRQLDRARRHLAAIEHPAATALRALDRKCPETPQELIFEARTASAQLDAKGIERTVGQVVRRVARGLAGDGRTCKGAFVSYVYVEAQP